MALYLLSEPVRRQLRHRHRRSPTWSTAARSGSSSTSTRTAASTTSPPAPTARGARTASPTPARPPSAPTSTATGATSGAAAAARAARPRARPTAARRRSRRPRPRACATSSTAASSAARSRSRPTSTSTPTRELILWPYGYTTANTAPGLTANDQAAFHTLGHATWRRPTATRPSRPSDLYITDGTIDDWMWGASPDLLLHVRDVPAHGERRRLLPAGDEIIAARDEPQPRGRAACCSRHADCPYRGDRQAAAAAPVPPPSTPTTSRPSGAGRRTPTAPTPRRRGVWERADPADTTSGGAKQLGTTTAAASTS